jgi:hypothetical protein
MGVKAVERIRDRSQAYQLFKSGKIKSTPWQTDFDEMAKKTVARRHSKVLPMSTDLDDLIRRDDELYNYADASDRTKPAAPAGGLDARLDALAAGAQAPAADPAHDAETGEIVDENDAAGARPAQEREAEARASARRLAGRRGRLARSRVEPPGGRSLARPARARRARRRRAEPLFRCRPQGARPRHEPPRHAGRSARGGPQGRRRRLARRLRQRRRTGEVIRDARTP